MVIHFGFCFLRTHLPILLLLLPGILIEENFDYLLPLPNWHPFWSLFRPHPSSCLLPAPQSAIMVEHKDVIFML
jgi:hypothetical protein